jgi:hypothetical protein
MSKLKNIPQEIISIAVEATDHHNDGWVMEQHRQKLLDIKIYIERILEDYVDLSKIIWEFKKD